SGLLLSDGRYHCAPVPVILYNGRIWRAMEDAMGDGGWGKQFHAFMMSAPEDADLLKRESWTFSNRIGRETNWLNGSFEGWLEGNAVVLPNGQMTDILRVASTNYPEHAAIIQISADGTKASFDPATDFVEFPGGAKKFTIRFDPKSKRYWSLANPVPEKFRSSQPDRTRNTLALVSSIDCRKWSVDKILFQNADSKTHGYQYVDWLFEGDDLIAVIRTAHDDDFSGAHNFHDSNYITFYRVKKFRSMER
ncbi:MAG: exo-alpha-sialidase, partial [Verrucomicrobiota bacterium]